MKTTHGLTGTSTYNSWANMRQRCLNVNNPEFVNYGNKGIVICNKLQSLRILSTGYRNRKLEFSA